jgi:hypothetical protein
MSEHWYTVDGKAAHSQPTKSKTAKNPNRPTTIKDAKALKLLPSVTSILKLIHNEPLQRWKYRKVVEACFNKPAVGDEELDGYTDFILNKAFDEADEAAQLGVKIHNCIETLLKGEDTAFEKSIIDYAESAINKVESLGIEVVESEFVTTNRHYGYAGTTDLAFKANERLTGILDFKSKRTKNDEPVVPSFGHAAQNAAYYASYWKEQWLEFGFSRAVCYNIYISTTEPGRIDVVKYDQQTLEKEFEMFEHALGIWRYKNAYDPRG